MQLCCYSWLWKKPMFNRILFCCNGDQGTVLRFVIRGIEQIVGRQAFWGDLKVGWQICKWLESGGTSCRIAKEKLWKILGKWREGRLSKLTGKKKNVVWLQTYPCISFFFYAKNSPFIKVRGNMGMCPLSTSFLDPWHRTYKVQVKHTSI